MARDPLVEPGGRLQGRSKAARASGHVIGYARVSTDDQSLALQRDALEQAGASQIYEERESGKRKDRPELANALKALRRGDTLIVWKMDRLGRSLVHLVEIVNALRERGVALRSITESNFDTTTANGALVFGLFALLAQYERELISERTKAGLKAARARGRNGGRPSRMTAQDVRQARAMLRDKDVSVREVMEKFNVSRTTLYKHIGSRAELVGGTQS